MLATAPTPLISRPRRERHLHERQFLLPTPGFGVPGQDGPGVIAAVVIRDGGRDGRALDLTGEVTWQDEAQGKHGQQRRRAHDEFSG
jgi:hypothetical protein